jgi:ferredoxin-NADP reductase
VPDFETGDVLYLTGEATILVGSDAAKVAPRAKLAVRIRIVAARFVCDGLPFRGDDAVDYSPYNPLVPGKPVAGDVAAQAITARAVATLVGREVLTPTIARFTFKLEGTKMDLWKPGQHVTLDFAEELNVGWSHMRDDDPGSLNDDFVRTFTVSSVPVEGKKEFQITVRRHGAATGLLWRWNLRVPLEVPVLGFGGEEEHRIPEVDDGKTAVFVAAGVGITPALAQVPGLIAAGRPFRVLWGLRSEDLGFADDVFTQVVGLAKRTTVILYHAMQ